MFIWVVLWTVETPVLALTVIYSASMKSYHFWNFNIKKIIKEFRTFSLHEPPRDKTNKMGVRPAKTQISLGIRPVWSESSLCTQWEAKDPRFLHADSEDSDQTGRSLRWAHTHWVFAGHKVILLVLSRGGSHCLLLVYDRYTQCNKIIVLAL